MKLGESLQLDYINPGSAESFGDGTAYLLEPFNITVQVVLKPYDEAQFRAFFPYDKVELGLGIDTTKRNIRDNFEYDSINAVTTVPLKLSRSEVLIRILWSINSSGLLLAKYYTNKSAPVVLQNFQKEVRGDNEPFLLRLPSAISRTRILSLAFPNSEQHSLEYNAELRYFEPTT